MAVTACRGPAARPARAGTSSPIPASSPQLRQEASSNVYICRAPDAGDTPARGSRTRGGFAGSWPTERRCQHQTTASAAQARAAIEAALGQIGFCLPGTITIRRARCGKPRCACAADPPALHGPYIQWTRTVSGKTVTRTLTPAQYQAYAPWFANARRLRALAAELQALSLKEMARAEGWATITPGTPAPPRTRPVRGPNPNYPKPPKTPGDQPA